MEKMKRTANTVAMLAMGLVVLLNIWIKCRKGLV